MLPWIASAGMPDLGEALHHLVGAVLGAGEHQRAVDRLLLQELGEEGRLGGEVDLDDALGDALDRGGRRRHRHAGGIAQHRLGEVGDVLRHGGREEQRLPLDRQFADDFADVVDEAHVEHAVGFVEHQELDRAEPQRVALHEIEQAAGGGDHDFDALHHRADLAAHRHAADRQRRGEADVAAIGVEAVEDLARQFAGRARAPARGRSWAAAGCDARAGGAGSAARRLRSCRCRSGRCRRRRVRRGRGGWSGPGWAWASDNFLP